MKLTSVAAIAVGATEDATLATAQDPKRSEGFNLGRLPHMPARRNRDGPRPSRRGFSSSGRMAAASFRSACVVILMLSAEPSTIAQRWPSASTSWQSSVTLPGDARALGIGLEEQVAAEDLRRLGQVELLAGDGLGREVDRRRLA